MLNVESEKKQLYTEKDLENDDIYYSNEASWQYMSASQYKDFTKCEAAALAKLKEDWQPKSDPIALLVGNYVHSYFESPEAHRDFKIKNKDSLFKEATVAQYKDILDGNEVEYKKSAKKEELLELINDQEITVPHGDLKSEFKVAEQMIERVEQDDLFRYLWQGDKEVPITGELYGVQWKGKIDLLNVERGYFVDLKTTADLSKRFWDSDYGRYVEFVKAYKYGLQLAVYEKLLEQKYGKSFTGYIYAVTKQTPSNIQAVREEKMHKDFELGLLKYQIDRVEAVKTGQEEPEMCGHCEYCRGHKKLLGFVDADELLD